MNAVVNPMILSVPNVMTLKTPSGKSYIAKASNEFNRGGEGRILTCDEDPKLVMKIYHPTRDPLSLDRFNHLSRLDRRWFVCPQELLYHRSQVVGFTMTYLPKEYFVLQNLFQKDFCKNNRITADKKFAIIKGLIAAINSAHKIGVIVGDLNQYNIMCNANGDIKLIDVDSYETPKHPHSGILLDEVRDHYYQGRVDKNSDYFALSVLVFNLITFVHPFKGIHKVFKKISDRMIHKVPIFKKDPELIVPKFYEPLQQNFLLAQFEKMYTGAVERFIINIEATQTASIIATAQLPKPTLVKKFDQDGLAIQEVLHGKIEDMFVLGGRMLVRTEQEYVLFDCSNKGYVVLLDKMQRSEWDSVYLGNDTMFAVRGDELFVQPKRNEKFVKATNFSVEKGWHFTQMQNILLILTNERLIKINMDRGYGSIIDFSVEHVASKAFNLFGGFFFRSGERQLFFHVDKGSVLVMPMPLNIVGLYQSGPIGMLTYIEKTKKGHNVINKYFKIEHGKVLVSSRDADQVYRFGLQMSGDDGFVFQPHNGFIRIIRTQDFEEVSRNELDICTAQSVIKHSPSGLLLWDDETIWLLNKR